MLFGICIDVAGCGEIESEVSKHNSICLKSQPMDGVELDFFQLEFLSSPPHPGSGPTYVF